MALLVMTIALVTGVFTTTLVTVCKVRAVFFGLSYFIVSL